MTFSKSVGSHLTLPAYALAAALFAFSFALTGCTGSSSTTIGTSAQQSSGTIQGKLIDSVTQEPIVGAVIDIGVATATTNTDGQFAMYNITIPVDANNQAKAVSYKTTINLRGVSSPVSMGNSTATPRYPDFSYDVIAVSFTPVYTAAPAASAVIPTPANGLIATVDFKVGKLAATIKGVVADSATLQAVTAASGVPGYTVNLVSLGSSDSATSTGGTGASENVAGSTAVAADGSFTFANIESLKNFRIDAFNSTQTYRGSKNVSSPSDGQTKILALQGNVGSATDAVLVSSVDTVAPVIVSTLIAQNGTTTAFSQNADIPASAVTATFTFSEAIKQTAQTGNSTTPPTASVPGGLYSLVDVNFNGLKASNLSHSLSWSADMKQLTVTILTLAASSTYSIDLSPAAGILKDSSGLAVTNIATAGKGILSFTTYSSATPPGAPTTVTPVNLTSLNFNSTGVVLNWAPVTGAKAYNVYRAQNWPFASGQAARVTGAGTVTTLSSDFTDTLPTVNSTPFTSGDNKITYTYTVRSVSQDNLESADSTPVTVSDNVKATVVSTTCANTNTSCIVTFSEPMEEASATTSSFYVVATGTGAAAPSIFGVQLNAGLTTATITFNGALSTGNTISISAVKDVSGNTMTPYPATAIP